MGSFAFPSRCNSSLSLLLPIWDTARKVSVSQRVLRLNLKIIFLVFLVRTEVACFSKNSGPRSWHRKSVENPYIKFCFICIHIFLNLFETYLGKPGEWHPELVLAVLVEKLHFLHHPSRHKPGVRPGAVVALHSQRISQLDEFWKT